MVGVFTWLTPEIVALLSRELEGTVALTLITSAAPLGLGVVMVGETKLEITAPLYTSRRPGEIVTLHFPREHIWLMPN